MEQYSIVKSRAVLRKADLPKKSKRQKEFLLSAKGQILSFSEAVDSARLIPKALVAESIVIAWPDE